MAKTLSLLPCELDDKWDDYINSSPDLSIYSNKIFLENIKEKLGLYACYKGKELRAVVILVEDENSKNAILNDYLIYSGICFGPPTNNQTRSQQLSERHEITVFIIKELANIYDSFKFRLSPSVKDIRPFQWHNYGMSSNRCLIDVRYTSYVNISDMKDTNSLDSINTYKNSSNSRRQQIRYAIRDKIKTKIYNDIEMFIDFYRSNLTRQSVILDPSFYTNLATLIDRLMSNNKAKMYLSSNTLGEPSSIAIFGIDKLRAHYLYGASNPELKLVTGGTAVLWDGFYDLARQGIKEVDLEGVNSPKRGWFKLSFGGSLVPYYSIEYPNKTLS
ncbi:GNAT family N-acetyltransferase [Prochlorococcus marinus]|uniref:GNAT family N-acetyltransferase n=1 Tax=Prochlorococcus marinus TaxID=1219 RepID=UPI0022B4683D|nr:GNAT family N-acetyltransferase [Prochlorococcus marinus]